MSFVAVIGRRALEELRDLGHVTAVVSAVLLLAARPSTWRRTVRDALGQQIFAVGAESVLALSLVAFVVGIPVVVQVDYWLREIGRSALLGPVLVTVMVREAGPILVNFVVIGRAVSVIAAELGSMKIAGEVRALDAQGLDPFLFLVLPRVLGVAVSVLCLSVLFVILSLLGGYLFGRVLGLNTGPAEFFDSVARAIGPADVWNVTAKALLPGLLSGAICCVEGLNTPETTAGIRQSMTRSTQRAVVALFVTSAIISVLTYS
jgi:phospholipid/cholesterol/gamma-HCH transport system permease protein